MNLKTIVACLVLAAFSVATPLHAFAQGVTLNGAGATFPFPLIDTWRVEYKKINAGVNLNYQSIGSGGGVKQFTAKTVDFGASDAPLTKNETSTLPSPAVHIPETIGSVVAAYHVDGVQKGLKLTGPILSDIYMGKIKKWNDPAIKEVNPDVNLPDKGIAVVHRSDGSGTTFVWTSYLSIATTEWKDKVGAGKSVQWPTGVGAPGNEGVANAVKQTPNAIGYVELAYALTTGMDFADIKNKAGKFITPSLETTSAAVGQTASSLPKGDEPWTNVSLLDASGDNSYPIASFSYLLVYKEMSTSINSADKAKALIDFIGWAIGPQGQQLAQKLNYVPLPDSVVKLNQQTLASLTYNGQPVAKGGSGSSSTEASYGGQKYTVSGQSANVKIASASIDAGKSVKVSFQGAGDVQLTLPKGLIEGISGVTASDGSSVKFEQVSSTAESTTIKMTVPQDAVVEITGAKVVPEFGVIAVAALAASLAAVTVLARQRTRFGL